MKFELKERSSKLLDGVKETSKIVNIVDNIVKTYECNENVLNRIQAEHQDLLHKIEFVDLDVINGYKIYKQLQELRIRRRILKDEQESIEPIYSYIKKNNSAFMFLNKIQSKCAMMNNVIENSKYNPRSTEIMTEEQAIEYGERYTKKLDKIKLDEFMH